MEAFSKEENEPTYEGKVIWFYENGIIYHEANYSKGILNGNRKVYYESGKLQNKRNYKDGKLNVVGLHIMKMVRFRKRDL